MNKPAVTISLEDFNSWQIVSISGALIVRALNDIRTILDAVENKTRAKIALDFTRTSYIDSSAITLLINLHQRIRAQDGQLVLFGPNRETGNIFSLVKIDCIIPIYKNREDFEKAVEVVG